MKARPVCATCRIDLPASVGRYEVRVVLPGTAKRLLVWCDGCGARLVTAIKQVQEGK